MIRRWSRGSVENGSVQKELSGGQGRNLTRRTFRDILIYIHIMRYIAHIYSTDWFDKNQDNVSG